MTKVTFDNTNAQFFTALKQSVDAYFKQNRLKKTGNFKLYLKTLVLIPAAIALYALVLFVPMSGWLAILLCALLGLDIAFIGFNVMHDACHGSYSTKKWVNYTVGLSMNAIGSNAFIWKIKHNIIHHTYTNIDGVDDDIAKLPVIRLCESQKRLKMHKYQHWYALFAYSLASLSWVLFTDFLKYFNQKIASTPINTFNTKEHLIFWASKVLYVLFYIAVPIYLVGFVKFLIGFSVMHAVMGITIGIVFQLAHAVENTQFLDANDDKHQKLETGWAEHQVATTSNFATKNKIVTWCLGGLNFQVEHHLFPRISHVHYPAINKIVIENCKKFGVTYNAYPTMRAAIISHFRYMKYVGQAA
ncbi:MAG: acyl-CoA desaturase [Bacteroidia bacterium]|nr:acyl-CoA desaturase [Bacteroidia bacterium]